MLGHLGRGTVWRRVYGPWEIILANVFKLVERGCRSVFCRMLRRCQQPSDVEEADEWINSGSSVVLLPSSKGRLTAVTSMSERVT